MRDAEKEIWKELDQAVFGGNDAKTSMNNMREQFQRELSSLGNYLTSLRKLKEWSVEQMAEEAGVPPDLWREWEMDLRSPTVAELEAVALCLGWGERKMTRILSLREKAQRYHLTRLTTFRPEFLAARGLAEEGGLAWESIDETTRARVRDWGAANGYSFPEQLAEFLRGLDSEEGARDAWITEILEG